MDRNTVHAAPNGTADAIDKNVEYLARGSNQSGMRAHNERLVLTVLRQHEAMAKADIARLTGLSAQTVSVIMRALESDGLIQRDAPVRGKVGQPSVPMRLAGNGAFFLGLKVGRRSAELVLTDFLGRARGRAMRLHDYPTPEAIVRFAITQINALLDGLSDSERARVAGLGIAIPFFMWNWARHLNVPEADMAAWRHANIRAEIAKAVPFPVFLQNDASAACGAELVFGPQDGPRDFLYFYIGYFIGGGLVLNGKLFTGRGNAAALGPLPVPVDGGTGQLIDTASLSVLESGLRAQGWPTAAMWESAEAWDLDQTEVEAWLTRAANGLAHAITACISLVDVEAVRIDGWLPVSLRAELVTRTTHALSQLDLTGLTPPEIGPGHVGPDARALGAASLPLSERFLVD